MKHKKRHFARYARLIYALREHWAEPGKYSHERQQTNLLEYYLHLINFLPFRRDNRGDNCTSRFVRNNTSRNDNKNKTRSSDRREKRVYSPARGRRVSPEARGTVHAGFLDRLSVETRCDRPPYSKTTIVVGVRGKIVKRTQNHNAINIA